MNSDFDFDRAEEELATVLLRADDPQVRPLLDAGYRIVHTQRYAALALAPMPDLDRFLAVLRAAAADGLFVAKIDQASEPWTAARSAPGGRPLYSVRDLSANRSTSVYAALRDGEVVGIVTAFALDGAIALKEFSLSEASPQGASVVAALAAGAIVSLSDDGHRIFTVISDGELWDGPDALQQLGAIPVEEWHILRADTEDPSGRR